MRLIDADKVEKITWQAPYYNDANNVLTEVRDKVQMLPTIDAIPIEWIEEKILSQEIRTTYRAVILAMIEKWREHAE